MANSKVLIIYTGGTIGMVTDSNTGRLKSFDFNHLYDHVPELQRLPIDKEAISFPEPIDSSEMNPEHWKRIADLIEANYDRFDGFVVLHGSDTMAYTASALSYALSGLQKPVILTGSQLPIGTIRTDGKENLITAIEIAGAKENDDAIVQEVAIYFEYHLYRGNRSTKDSASLFNAFRSPNYPELATAGVDIDYNKKQLLRSDQASLKVNTEFSERVALLKIYPGFNVHTAATMFDRTMVDGLVIESFGAGNAPSSGDLFSFCKSFIEQGGHILNITQCSSGSVHHGMYETSGGFLEAGVIEGHDLTAEAAITKMMFALGQDEPAKVLSSNLAGELTI